MPPLETLMRIRALLGDPKRWTKGDYQSRDRSAYCLLGAADAVGGQTRCLYEAAARERPYGSGSIVNFNDRSTTTHQMVLEFLDRAIEAEWNEVQGATCDVVREAVCA